MNNLLNVFIIPIITLACVQVVHAECVDGIDVIDAIIDQNSSIDDLAKHDKYIVMAKSPFSFLRATNHLFWACYGDDERLKSFGGKKETRTWIQGDLHIDNFGTYNFGAFDNDEGDKQLVYDLTDFDEAVIADYQYDVWRLAASLVIVAEHHDFGKKQKKKIIESFVDAYLKTLKRFAGAGNDYKLDKFGSYKTKENAKGKLEILFADLEEQETPRQTMLDKHAPKSNDGKRLFNTKRVKLKAATPEDKEAIRQAITGYRGTLVNNSAFNGGYFEIKDIARRIKSGLGGMGLDRYYVLIEGRTAGQDDDVILDIKYQPNPTPISYLPTADRELYGRNFNGNHGQRQAIAYRALVGDADPHLGWMNLTERQYSVRERSPFKKSLPISYLDDKKDFMVMAEQWGAILATKHARADKDFNSTLVPFSLEEQVTKETEGKKDQFKKRVYKIANEFAKKVEKDWDTFREHLSIKLNTPNR